jgi:formyltetrahydrofolate deformylase
MQGVIAALAQLLFGLGCNILESDQYTDTAEGMYFQRIHFDFSDIVVCVRGCVPPSMK